MGGTFRWSWSRPDGRPGLSIWGVNREIVPMEKIVHTENMEVGDGVQFGAMLATVVLTEVAGQTLLRMTLLFPSKAARDGAIASGMSRGVAIGYELLESLFAKAC